MPPIATAERTSREVRKVPDADNCTGTDRSNSGLKNRLAIAAKMIGMKPVTAATISRPELPITSDLKSP